MDRKQIGVVRAAQAGGKAPADPPAAAHERQPIYCRRLGHYLEFSYCRRAESGRPCPRVLDCWHERPAVLECLRREVGAEALASCVGVGPPAGKLESILQILARVSAAARERGVG